MEDIYILNFDCIQCFEFAKYKTYFQILFTCAGIFPHIYSISSISGVKQFDRLEIFKYLTSVDFGDSKILRPVITKYINSYWEKYGVYPLLRSIVIPENNFDVYKASDVTKLTNLNKFDHMGQLFGEDILNKMSNLTYLSFKTYSHDCINNFQFGHNLKVLCINGRDYAFPNFINHDKYLNLNTLKISCKATECSDFIIEVPTLTHLFLFQSGVNKYNARVKLNTFTNLKHLEIRYVDIEDLGYVLSMGTNMRTLIMQSVGKLSDKSLVISNMINLEYLESISVNVELIELKKMTRLNTVKIKY